MACGHLNKSKNSEADPKIRLAVDETNSHGVLPEDRVFSLCFASWCSLARRFGFARFARRASRDVGVCFRGLFQRTNPLSLRFPPNLTLIDSSRPSWLFECRFGRSFCGMSLGSKGCFRFLYQTQAPIRTFRGSLGGSVSNHLAIF